ncbi:hypothetical protein [Streptomyces sp. NPDC102409]|uniref:hypothetical protein n=1 Tax=Streptomyces sp. NPDC102409 TaxID=3366172 RepID=UPI0037FDF31F
MQFSGLRQDGHPARGKRKVRTRTRWVRMAGVYALRGAASAVGPGVVSLIVWWIQSR